jgi:hypothetical protein
MYEGVRTKFFANGSTLIRELGSHGEILLSGEASAKLRGVAGDLTHRSDGRTSAKLMGTLGIWGGTQ